MITALIRRLKMTRFERAYIDLYNDRITAAEFAKAAGIADSDKAWEQLHEYRRRVIQGEIPDPRSKYDLWR